ncbi:MAG: outer membrane protein assembly factor BamB family protein, partial [Planctomycetota bacterium]
MRNLVSICVFLLLLAPCAARTITVDDDGPADFNNIQAAIDDANDGDTVIVKDGVYKGVGNRDIDFKNKAITVRSTDPNDPNVVAATIIDCEDAGRGFDFHSGEDSSSVLAGFTITNGFASYGGGIYCHGSSPKISNCIISGNSATYSGGGAYCVKGTIRGCTISRNNAFGYKYYDGGGGLYLVEGTVTSCTISENSASRSVGGGICSVWYGSATINDCNISGNSASEHGGGLYMCDRVINCIISGNRAGMDGGGLYMCKHVANCAVTGNTAILDGGGMRDCLLVTSSIINGNKAEYDGGGAYYRFIEGSRIISCTISGNIALEGTGGGIHPSYRWGNTNPALTNCIVWGNTDSSSPVELAQFYATDPEVWFSCIQDDDPNDANIPFGGEANNNIDDNAMFVRDPNDGGDGWGDDPATPDVNEGANDDFGDLHITPDSPCINSGDPCLYIGVDYGDIDGQPRIMGFRADMGADEFLIPWITVTKPEEGEVWASGSVREIEWESYGVAGPIDISYSATNGSEWTAIVDSMANTGNYLWHLPDVVDSNQCVISVVSSVPDPNVVIIDSGLFTIQRYPSRPPAPPGQIGKWDNFRRTGLSDTYGPEIGCVKWQFETEGPVSASVSVGPNSTVYVPCEDGNLYKLDANGTLLWSYDTNSPIISSPAVGYYGMIYVGGENGKLYAIDGKGKLRWTHTADGFVYSSAAVSAEGHVYVCSEDGKLYALGPDGSELWTFETPGAGAVGSPILASPSIGPDGTVYVTGLRDPNLYALDPNNGGVKWACSFERVV